jgi:hypothetical protein
MASRPAAAVSRKGQSGNPRGRSPGAKNLKTLLSDALNEFVIVTENGGHRKITTREAIITSSSTARSADFRAIKILRDMGRDIEGQTEPASAETASFSEANAKVIEQLRARFSKAEK